MINLTYSSRVNDASEIQNDPVNSKPKILVIEDNDLVRNLIKVTLQRSNYSVVEAEDGLTGLELAYTTNPDLIVCDLDLPRLSGDKLFSVLRGSPVTATIQQVLVSGYYTKEEFEGGVLPGANGYLSKPFSVTELLQIVNSRLAV